ncbi:hypothetical protein [Saccharibacillus endophyticus]|uniref:Uncharacterized protein n=1 Tax=Saccharibacillus endophyticus TaxID=2060666 RepID=A0ABQ1ZU93_9BACL|nr:hypothetical protein [Saccharibacillus endophyticus]GGH78091.1 hypothetical protein GCM10007362_22850 [Saccharibacillus endophyticus]
MIKWRSLLVLIVPFIFLIFTDFDIPLLKDQQDTLKDQIELTSWIFSGIMALISFLALFIGYMYENKLIAASNDLKLIFRPYTLTISEVRQILISYESNTSRDRLITYMYWIYLIVSASTIYVWGITVGFYTEFKYSLKIDFSLPAVVNLNIYLFYLLLSGLLIVLTFILFQIKNLKDPLRKGYLPTAQELIDMKFLDQQDSDINEIIIKNTPSLTFYKNLPRNSPTYEAVFSVPIKFKNLKFVIKLYDENGNIAFTCYGYLIEVNHVGDQFFKRLTDNLGESIYNKLRDNGSGEIKIYSANHSILCRVSLKSVINDDNSFTVIPQNIIFDREAHERDHTLIARLNSETIMYN